MNLGDSLFCLSLFLLFSLFCFPLSFLKFCLLSFLLIFVALSFFLKEIMSTFSLFLSLCHSSVLLILHPLVCQQSAPIFIHSLYSSPSVHLSPFCLYLPSSLIFLLSLQYVNLSWQWPPSHTSAIKDFQYSLIKISQKTSIKGPFEIRKCTWCFVRIEKGMVRHLEPLVS